ncbi:MAG: protein phosphatase 2C domain-containing protein [Phycisphaerae bacterium]|nr:protein phosphatase 2C domain-containing protein [Phycisphaerae bacterium]
MFQVSCQSTLGRRESQEDACRVLSLRRYGELEAEEVVAAVVCDGVGGNVGGEFASAIAAEAVTESLIASGSASLLDSEDAEGIRAAVTASFEDANQRILAEAQRNPELNGMGTTVTLALLFPKIMYVCWVGDSPAFVYANGELTKLTREHTVVAELIARGELDPQRAAQHPAAHTITRYAGDPRGCRPEVASFPIRGGELLLAFSDGLTDVLSPTAIQSVIEEWRSSLGPLHDLSTRLVAEALLAGSQDNITAVCIENDSQKYTEPTCTHGYRALRAKRIRNHVSQENLWTGA